MDVMTSYTHEDAHRTITESENEHVLLKNNGGIFYVPSRYTPEN